LDQKKKQNDKYKKINGLNAVIVSLRECPRFPFQVCPARCINSSPSLAEDASPPSRYALPGAQNKKGRISGPFLMFWYDEIWLPQRFFQMQDRF